MAIMDKGLVKMLVAAGCLACCGCATLCNKEKSCVVSVSSKTPGVHCRVFNRGKLINEMDLPGAVSLRSSHGVVPSSYEFEFSKEGYEGASITRNCKFCNYLLGNVVWIWGAPIGLLIDFCTGSAYTISDANIEAQADFNSSAKLLCAYATAGTYYDDHASYGYYAGTSSYSSYYSASTDSASTDSSSSDWSSLEHKQSSFGGYSSSYGSRPGYTAASQTSYDNPEEDNLGSSWTITSTSLGGGTRYDHSDGSFTTSSQTLGGGTRYENSSGWSVTTSQTLGGGTRYDHSDGSFTTSSQTLGGGTRYENSSGWSATTSQTLGGGTQIHDSSGRVGTVTETLGGGVRVDWH